MWLKMTSKYSGKTIIIRAPSLFCQPSFIFPRYRYFYAAVRGSCVWVAF